MKRLLLILCVFLYGCSFDYIGNGREDGKVLLNEQGLTLLEKGQPVTKNMLQTRFGDEYTVRSGVHLRQGNMNQVFDIVKDNKVLISLYVREDGQLDYLVVFDAFVNTTLKNNPHVGTVFSQIYDKAFGSCLLDNVTEVVSEVNCLAPNSNSIHFIFSGEWKGPKSLLPSDDVLKKWQVNRIVWFAKN